MAKTGSEKVRRLVSNYFTNLKGTEIRLGGKDLLKMGFSPGPFFKEIFDRLLEARLNDLVKTKADEIRFVEETFEH
jgi:tRNA nucleotidyltransferase (CCA-adding enzyme)